MYRIVISMVSSLTLMYMHLRLTEIMSRQKVNSTPICFDHSKFLL